MILLYACLEQHTLILKKQEIKLTHLPEEWDGLKVLQISDLHHRKFGKGNRRIIELAAQQKPDWIVITGDLVSRDFRPEKELAEMWAFLTGLRKIASVYLCLGNHELDMIRNEVFQPVKKVIEETGCRLLDNEKIYFQRDGAEICLAGASLKFNVYRDENWRFRNLQDYTIFEMIEDLGDKETFTLMLAHNPLMMETYTLWGADLVLCGHVHGGVVRLPGLGGLLSPERRFFPRYDLGLYQNRATYMYVSGGLGKLRLFNPPEINLLYLKSVNKK